MNVFLKNPPSSLGEDLLLLIFEYLDEGDLCKCEDVCQQWRTIFKAGTPWRRLLRRQVALCDMWRQAWLSMGLDEMKVPREHFRTICRAIVRYGREMDHNLRTGEFETTDHIIPFNPPSHWYLRYRTEKDGFSFESNNHYKNYRSINFVDKVTMKITSFRLQLEQDTEWVSLLRRDIFLLKTRIQFFNKNTGQLLHQLTEDTDWIIQGCVLSDKLLTVHSNNSETKSSRLRFWQMENPFTLTYLKEIAFDNELPQRLDGDNKFLCIYQHVQGFHDESRRLVQFVSTKTLKIKTSLSCTAPRMKYEGGLFFTWTEDQLFQILDVASGAFLWRTREPFNFGSFPILRTNSKYMVSIEHIYTDNEPEKSEIKFFDLHAIRNANARADSLLLTSLKVQIRFADCFLDETQFMFFPQSQWCKIVVMDFGAYHRYKYLSPATW